MPGGASLAHSSWDLFIGPTSPTTGSLEAFFGSWLDPNIFFLNNPVWESWEWLSHYIPLDIFWEGFKLSTREWRVRGMEIRGSDSAEGLLAEAPHGGVSEGWPSRGCAWGLFFLECFAMVKSFSECQRHWWGTSTMALFGEEIKFQRITF